MLPPGICLLVGALLAAFLGEAAGTTTTCFDGNATYPLCSDAACAGSCTATVGCYCGDPPIQCIPAAADGCDSTTNPPTPCCPEGLFWYPALQCCSAELNCDPACVTGKETCSYVAGEAVCLCNDMAYLHANRSQIAPTVDCSSDVMTVSISKCLLERFQYSASNMHLLVNSTDCSDYNYEDIVNNERMLFKQVPIQNGYCGSTFSVQDGKVTYTNALYIPPDFNLPIIISSALNMSFSCTYNMTMQTSLQTVLHPLIGTVTLPAINGTGTAQATMAAYTNDAFTIPYQAGDELTVGSPIYIGIMTSFADGGNFTLRAESCVAAPSNASYDTNGVDLITDGCALNQDVNAQYVQNGESMEVRFKMDTFVFQDMPEVYIRCDVRLCKKETPDVCKCGSSSLARSADVTASLSIGPLDLSASIDLGSGSSAVVSSLAVMWSSLLVLLSLRLF